MNDGRMIFGFAMVGLLVATRLIIGQPCWAEEKPNKTTNRPLYELRTYTTVAGKLPDLHKRFCEHTMQIFEKHGIKNVIYWTPEDKENTLVYVVSHKSRESAARSWAAFRQDPEWQKAFKESRAGGPLVMKVESQFLTTTDYSPTK